MISTTYGEAIRLGFEYLLDNYPEVFVIGQGLWSPWYVGNSMTDLDKKYGLDRIIDTPVSECACTGAAVGASLAGMKPIVVHPRMDFMLFAVDPIVNQAAKWSHMVGGQDSPALTIRSIINRGGQQGAQHSQALHSWFAHVPGLRVVMPSTVKDARDLLIASVLSPDPVLYIDDRWLYSLEDSIPPPSELSLLDQFPIVSSIGSDITIVGASYSSDLALRAKSKLLKSDINAEVIDLRVLNPLQIRPVLESVCKTRRLLVVDGGWRNCGIAGELISSVMEEMELNALVSKPRRVTLPDCPAPCSGPLEDTYYFSESDIVDMVKLMF
ncbi:transketolase-like protein [Synechococcus sp. BOUM118]|nr:transketolase-like protein [Synechococcus sp. BOUM118]